MAKTSMIVKAARTPRFRVRKYNRCPICGRAKAYIRQYNLCRICFRNMALAGEIPGVIKASW